MAKLFSILLLSSLFCTANALVATKQNISSLLRELRLDLKDSQANSDQLDEVYLLLEEAQDILVNGQASPVDFTTCYNYLFPLYDRNTSSSQASSKATKACREVHDMDVLEFSFEQFDRNLSTANAIDQAVSYNTRSIRGKLAIVEFAYEKYDRGLSSMSAIEKALKGAQAIGKDALACLQLIFPQHDRTTSSMHAMDKTFADCQ